MSMRGSGQPPHDLQAIRSVLVAIMATVVSVVAVAQQAPPAEVHEMQGMDAAPAAAGSTMQDMSAMPMDGMPGMDRPHAGHAQSNTSGSANGAAGKPPVSLEEGRKLPADHGGNAHVGDQDGGMSSSMIMPRPDAPTGLPANDHMAPAPPSHTMPAMAPAQMIDMMQMDDQATRGMWLFDRLEHRHGSDGEMTTAWEADGWWGGDIDKLWFRSEGETSARGTQDARAELLWSHAFSTFWDWWLGARDDFGQGGGRQWAAFGVQGLAPYWFDLDATLYVGPQGRTAARLEASYDLRFTQKLILTPDLELNFYGKDDLRHDQRTGLSDADLGLRLRYEFSRRFAPYIGVNWSYRQGGEAAPPTIRNEPAHDVTWLVGVRFWL